jgi:hypothetical protein
MNWLLTGLIVSTLAATYVFWIRPLLKTTPTLGHFYAQEESFWQALNFKLGGLKQKLTTVAVMVTGFVVSAYDILAPLMEESGIQVETLTSKVPPQAWPVIGMVVIGLVQYFRKLSDKRDLADALAPVTVDQAKIEPVVIK